jgi:hypothetical protein
MVVCLLSRSLGLVPSFVYAHIKTSSLLAMGG